MDTTFLCYLPRFGEILPVILCSSKQLKIYSYHFMQKTYYSETNLNHTVIIISIISTVLTFSVLNLHGILFLECVVHLKWIRIHLLFFFKITF